MPDLESALRARREGGGQAFVPYVTGGLAGVDPDLLRGLEEAGADAIEVGIPFSDPVMDGGVIQEASRRALEGGTRIGDVLATVEEARLGIPVAVMTYFNPIFHVGPTEFLARAADAGIAGLIVPDLPVDEADDWIARCGSAGIAPVLLAAPGSPPERLRRIAEGSRGFVYCVATYGVTGEREHLSGTAHELVEALRPLTDRPLLVGVGIGTPEQATQACRFADGVIVGSALVRLLVEGRRDAALEMARQFRAAIPR
ncbi:MAG TPA: tryptophan synthase subunit alpha [Actinomycetota bacterium]